MKLALLPRPRTRSILDGRIKAAGFSIEWFPTSAPLGWQLPAAEEHRSIAPGRFDGGEMSISSFVTAKARGAPLLALPAFLKRGLVERSLFCDRDSALTLPEQLQGKCVGLMNYTSSMATWMRGILSQHYGLSRSAPRWFSVTPAAGKAHAPFTVLDLPADYATEAIPAWEELDGDCHDLERGEAFLLALLAAGKLDAVVSYQTRIDTDGIRPLLTREALLASPDGHKGVYPINHIFVLRESVFDEAPDIGDVLLSILKQARGLWLEYVSRDQAAAMEQELDRLGWDPFAYRLGEIEKRTLETFVEYLYAEQRIDRRPGWTELLHPDSIDSPAQS